jgi:hypothetical protein
MDRRCRQRQPLRAIAGDRVLLRVLLIRLGDERRHGYVFAMQSKEVDIVIPDYQTLMRPVLEVAAESEISVRDCTAALADRLSAAERSERLPSGRQTIIANRVHWAKTYLSQAGLLEMTRRGHFKATPRGL